MYRIAKGLVKISIPSEMNRNTVIWSMIPPPSMETMIATSAPIANQIVVNPTVTISMMMSMIIAASHTIVYVMIPPPFLIRKPVCLPLSCGRKNIVPDKYTLPHNLDSHNGFCVNAVIFVLKYILLDKTLPISLQFILKSFCLIIPAGKHFWTESSINTLLYHTASKLWFCFCNFLFD